MSNSKFKWPFRAAEYSNFWCQTDGDCSSSGNNWSRFAWEIKNFTNRPEGKGEYVRSKVFHVIGPTNTVVSKWVIRVYPKGSNDSEEGKLCISLENVSGVKVAARGLLYIEDKEGSANQIISFEDDDLGHDWIRENANVSLADGFLLQDDSLIIVGMIFLVKTDIDLTKNHFVEMKHNLMEAYKNKDPVLYDVTVKCGNATFECNKFMLTARSPVFKAMFQSNMIENQTNTVNIKDLKPTVVEGMIQYIHTGVTSHIYKAPRNMLAAADRYQLEQLKTSCQIILVDSLDVENCIPLLILSDMYNACYLRKTGLKYASENMKSISNSCDWKKELVRYPSLMADMIETLANMNDSLKKDLKSSQEYADELLQDMEASNAFEA